MKYQKFIDSVTLYAKAGKGGDGAASFRREKFIPHGGPDGGDGGRGGHVILQVEPNESSLINVYYQPHQRAEPGGGGMGKQMYGRNGKDCIVKVPRGTEVRDKETESLITELLNPGETYTIAEGGKGGLGNIHWKTSTTQAPTEHTDGEPGEEKTLHLLLKLVADIGLVGYPNAGKSSILTKISHAHPKIAAYPFTTLNPIIGTMKFDDYTKLSVADIPGLIDGAHLGTGLGHEFLRHIERSNYLLIVIDMAGTDGRVPHEDYHALLNELELYRHDLVERPRLVVANKMDSPDSEENLKEFLKNTQAEPICISAETGDGVDKLVDAIDELTRDYRRAQ